MKEDPIDRISINAQCQDEVAELVDALYAAARRAVKAFRAHMKGPESNAALSLEDNLAMAHLESTIDEIEAVAE